MFSFLQGVQGKDRLDPSPRAKEQPSWSWLVLQQFRTTLPELVFGEIDNPPKEVLKKKVRILKAFKQAFSDRIAASRAFPPPVSSRLKENSLPASRRPTLPPTPHPFSSLPKRGGHPNKLIEEFRCAFDVRVLEQVSGRIKHRFHVGKIYVHKDRHQTQLAQHRQKTLNHAGTAEWSGRHPANADRLVDVLFEVGVEHVLQKARVAVVVFGRDDHQRVGLLDGCRKARVFDPLACVVGGKGQLTHIDQARLYLRTLGNLSLDKPGNVFALPTLARCAEQNGDEEVTIHARACNFSRTAARNRFTAGLPVGFADICTDSGVRVDCHSERPVRLRWLGACNGSRQSFRIYQVFDLAEFLMVSDPVVPCRSKLARTIPVQVLEEGALVEDQPNLRQVAP